MGLRGPLPKAPELRVVTGGKRRRAADHRHQHGVHAPVAAPPMPDHLGADAAAEWRRVTALLLELKLVAKLDMAAVALYCQAYGTMALIERALQAEMQRMADAGRDPADALLETSDRSGLRRASTLARMAASARIEVERYLAALAMTPAARARLTAGRSDGQETDPGAETAGPGRFFR